MLRTQSNYDVVIIGAGSGGLTAAIGFAKAGKHVLLIERNKIGGDCTYTGCIPSKALLHYAQQHHAAPDTHPADKAFDYVQEKIQHVAAQETPDILEQSYDIDVAFGTAAFTGPNELKISDASYQFKTAVIATGAQPRTIDIEGLQTSQLLTNENLFDLSAVPNRTLVLGSGPIGLEMGYALALLGSHVTIVTRDTHFAGQEEPSIGRALQAHFRELGVDIYCNASLTRVEQTTGIVQTHSNTKKDTTSYEEVHIPFDYVLQAIGRVPSLPEGLTAAGIAHDNAGIKTNSQHRTTNRHVYAIGDAASELQFTHVADADARAVVAHSVSYGFLRARRTAVPKVTYTNPEIAQVGLDWNTACAQYGEDRIRRVEVPLHAIDRASTDDALPHTNNESEGRLLLIATRLTGRVLGVHIMVPRAGELIAPATMALDHRLSVYALRRTIFAYPTYGRLIKKAADAFLAEQFTELTSDLIAFAKRHTPKAIAAIFWGTLVFAFYYYKTTNGLSYEAILLQLWEFFTSTMYGPLVYIVLYAIRPLIFFPATLLTALSGVLFGFWWGVLYTVLGENASANFAYWIGRFFGKDLNLEHTAIGNWITALRRNSFETVLLMRLFYVPFDLTNYGAGVVGAKWREYFLATVIGIMPGLTTFVALGASLDLEELRTNGLTFDAFDPWYLALSVALFGSSLVFSRFLKRSRSDMKY